MDNLWKNLWKTPETRAITGVKSPPLFNDFQTRAPAGDFWEGAGDFWPRICGGVQVISPASGQVISAHLQVISCAGDFSF